MSDSKQQSSRATEQQHPMANQQPPKQVQRLDNQSFASLEQQTIQLAHPNLPHHTTAALQAAQSLHLAGLVQANGGNPAIASALSQLAALLASFATARALAEKTEPARQRAVVLISSLQEQASMLEQPIVGNAVNQSKAPHVPSSDIPSVATSGDNAMSFGFLVNAIQQYAASQRHELTTAAVPAETRVKLERGAAGEANGRLSSEIATALRQGNASSLPWPCIGAAAHQNPPMWVDKDTKRPPEEAAAAAALTREEKQPVAPGKPPDFIAFVPKRKRRKYTHESFVCRLFRMLKDVEEVGKTDVISFNAAGDAVVIKDAVELASGILPHYFCHNQFRSFRRQLSVYGFRRHKEGPDKGAYSHRLFRRGHPELLAGIEREVVPPSEKDHYGAEPPLR